MEHGEQAKLLMTVVTQHPWLTTSYQTCPKIRHTSSFPQAMSTLRFPCKILTVLLLASLSQWKILPEIPCH